MIKSAELENSAYEFEAKMPLRHAVPLGLQHVFAMFVGNLTPLLIITSACGLAGGEFADLQVSLLQNAMFVAGIVTLVQLYGLGPVGGKVPIIMGTSSGFLGVFNSVAATMAYGAMMGASILGGLFESVLGVFLKPLRKLFPPVVTGTVVLSSACPSSPWASTPSAAATQPRTSARWRTCCWPSSCWWSSSSSSTGPMASSALPPSSWASSRAIWQPSSWASSCPPPASPPTRGVHQSMGAELEQGR